MRYIINSAKVICSAGSDTLPATITMLSRSPHRIYRPAAYIPLVSNTTATNLSPNYSTRSDPRLHWRPQLSAKDIAIMGLTDFNVHYSSFAFIPAQWRLVSNLPLPLGRPLDIQGVTHGSSPGVVFLQEVADLTSDGDLVVYGWNLSQLQEITNHSRGFMMATDFLVPYDSLQSSLMVWMIYCLPRCVARVCLRLRYL